MAKFVLSTNFFEFNSDTFRQISGTAIGTKFAPPYACIYMDQVEQKILATQIKTTLKQLEGILRSNMYLLNMNAAVKQTFTPVPIVSYRSSRKLSSYLVRAKLYPIDRTVGSKGCGKKRCEVCVNVCETDTFTSTVTGETFKINHKLNCDDKCLIYLFTCECCSKQYVGETSPVVSPTYCLGLAGTTIDVMTGNILGMRTAFRKIYIDIFIVGNIQVSLKMSR